MQKLTVGMSVLTACLGLAALFAPGLRDQRQLSGLEAEIRRLDPDVRAVERLMGDLERRRRLLATAQEITSKSVHPLAVVRELTEILPSDVWLTALSLDPKGVELTGQAATASPLIPLLENSPRLERVEFSSPVTRGRDKEQFRIRATWEIPSSVTVTVPSPPPTPTRGPTPAVPGVRPRPKEAPEEESEETAPPSPPSQRHPERRGVR
jgi:Tfp pilus assembly protein PilN